MSEVDKVKQAEIDSVKQQLNEALKQDEGLAAIRKSCSDKVAVVGIVRARGIAGGSPKDTLGRIVGYRVKNVGDTALVFDVRKHKQGENGVYAPYATKTTVEPGAEVVMNKTSMGMEFFKPQYFGYLQNGVIKADTDKFKDNEELLANTTFAAKKESGFVVTDNSITEFCDDNSTGTWQIKPEYAEDFGFLVNKASTAQKKSEITEREATAFYIYTKAKEAGLIPAEM